MYGSVTSVSTSSGFSNTQSSYSFFSPPPLIRDLCLMCTLLLLRTQAHAQPENDQSSSNRRRSVLSTTTTDQSTAQQSRLHRKDRNTTSAVHVDVNSAIALATRAMFAVLACQMAARVTPVWVIAPVALAYLLGFMTDVVSMVLVAFYFLVTCSSHKFWLVDPTAHAYAAFERHALRFEFTHSVSIISGLHVLFTIGPGDLWYSSTMIQPSRMFSKKHPAGPIHSGQTFSH